ncbi:MAG: rod shape-determining protein MreC [Gammaproteobacteria bacterium]|nr:rod shape-determining protein MreC [Gammaproteobacteria bacterium]MCP4882039.1 rod shape-determining protein MreC [Gammaproteobacteria bacterium]
MDPLFKGTGIRHKLSVYVVLSLLLIVADYQLAPMQKVRSWLSVAVTPVQWMVDLPEQSWTWLNDRLQEREMLLSENRQLRAQLMLAELEVQKLASLTAENVRLRELLHSSQKLNEEVMATQLIGVNPDPFIHQIVINDGSQNGVNKGQAVLDQTGVMGQVTAVTPFTSRVLLVTDANHAIPVQVNRTGLRSVAYGRGNYDTLELTDIPHTQDIKVGDLLVSSGLGMRFPEGYPVARVTLVERDMGREFTRVLAKPTARLSLSRQLLLVNTAHQQIQQALQED